MTGALIHIIAFALHLGALFFAAVFGETDHQRDRSTAFVAFFGAVFLFVCGFILQVVA